MDGIVETYHSFQLTSSIHSFQLIPTLPLPSCRLAMDGIVETLLRFVTRLLVSPGCLVQGFLLFEKLAKIYEPQVTRFVTRLLHVKDASPKLVPL